MTGQKETHVVATRSPYSVYLLIPKRRGLGFLKNPVGDHVNDLDRFITGLGFECASEGGVLDVSTTQAGNGRAPSDFENSIVKPIAEYLGMPYRIVLDITVFWMVRDGKIACHSPQESLLHTQGKPG